MTAEERSAAFIAEQLKRSDPKDLEEAARALTEHVMQDEWLRVVISEMDPDTASMLSDSKRLHETVLKMLKVCTSPSICFFSLLYFSKFVGISYVALKYVLCGFGFMMAN